MEHLASFSFVLRPFSLGLTSLCVLVGELDSGDRETVILCGHANGRQWSKRSEASQVVDMDDVVNRAEAEAQAMGLDTYLPMSWVRTQDAEAWGSELAALRPAASEALRSAESRGVRAVLARVGAPVVLRNTEDAQA